MEQVLRHLGLFDNLRGRGQQRRGPCPIHGQPADTQPTFSAHLGKNIFQCFHADCRAQGNVLDLWAAVHHLPLYEAALHLAETFPSHGTEKRNPLKEPVNRRIRCCRNTPTNLRGPRTHSVRERCRCASTDSIEGLNPTLPSSPSTAKKNLDIHRYIFLFFPEHQMPVITSPLVRFFT